MALNMDCESGSSHGESDCDSSSGSYDGVLDDLKLKEELGSFGINKYWLEPNKPGVQASDEPDYSSGSGDEDDQTDEPSAASGSARESDEDDDELKQRVGNVDW